jgi:UTP--glucose-1-phosphate uridylyltransferase
MQQMSEVFAEQNADCVIAVQEVDKDQVDKYGIVETTKIDNKTFSITNMVEKPKVEEAKSNLAVVGRYILSPKIFPILKKLFEEKKSTGDSAELQITTALNTMVHTGHKVIAYKFDGKRFDCGSVDGMMEANSFVYKENLYIK